MRVRALGVIPIPTSETGETTDTVQKKCDDYAKSKAIHEFVTAGKVSNLTTFQNDMDECTATLERRRHLRQALVLTVGLGVAGYLGFVLWKAR